MNQQSNIIAIDINAVKSRILEVRNQQVLLDRDVAALYGVETRVINQAVKNNPEKFPNGYVAELFSDEFATLRSKFLTANISSKSRALPEVGTLGSGRAFRVSGLFLGGAEWIRELGFGIIPGVGKHQE